MILREFIYFDKEQEGPADDKRYISQNDSDVLKDTDLRKTRLTLKMINEIRKAAEAHEREHIKDMGLIRRMYAAPPPGAPQ